MKKYRKRSVMIRLLAAACAIAFAAYPARETPAAEITAAAAGTENTAGNTAGTADSKASDVVIVGGTSALELYYAVEKSENVSPAVKTEEPSCGWVASADADENWLKTNGLPAARQLASQGGNLVILSDTGYCGSGSADKYLNLLNAQAETWENAGLNVYCVSGIFTGDGDDEEQNEKIRSGLDGRIRFLDFSDFVKKRTAAGQTAKWRGELGREIYLELMDEVTADYSLIYDFNYYKDHNPDLAEKCTDENSYFNNFLAEGMRAGRQAKDDFEVNSYRERYPEYEESLGDDLTAWYMHYATEGAAKGLDGSKEVSLIVDGLDYSPVYDYDFYRAKYPSLRKKYGNDRQAYFDDFINEGMASGRQGSSGFDPEYYKEKNPDLAASLGEDLRSYYRHFAEGGKHEGGSATGYLTAVIRLENYTTGLYDFTASHDAAASAAKEGWENEGIAWYAPENSSEPVWKTENTGTGRTSFYTDEEKYRAAVNSGETDLGIAFYADDKKSVPVYRLASPDGASELYTIDEDEYNSMLVDGYLDGGTAWYASATVAATSASSVGIYSDGSDYSIEATVNLQGSGSGFIAKVDMLSSGSGEAFDFVYDTGWNRNSESTYFYLENIMSHASEPGLRGKDYTYINSPVGKVGQSITLRLSWYQSERMLRAFVNGNQVAETATTNGVPETFALEGGGKYAGDAVNAVFTNVRVKKNGVVTAYSTLDGSNCRAENYNGYGAAAAGQSVIISGAAAVPAGTNWDTSIAITGHALGAYCILK